MPRDGSSPFRGLGVVRHYPMEYQVVLLVLLKVVPAAFSQERERSSLHFLLHLIHNVVHSLEPVFDSACFCFDFKELGLVLPPLQSTNVVNTKFLGL